MTSTAGTRGRDATFEAIHSAPEWRSYLQLINGWYRQPLSEATGVPADELSQLEEEAGRPLPAMLWEWFRLFGNHESLGDETCDDYVMPLDRVWEASGSLRLYGENQELWYCCILDEDLEEPDPPVYFDSAGMSVEEWGFPLEGVELVDEHFIPVCDTLSRFLMGLTVRQITLRTKPSPFFRAGVCGAQFTPSFGLGPIQQLFEFPGGPSSPCLGEDVVLLKNWAFSARTTEVLARLEQAAREAGRPLPAVRVPGQPIQFNSIWVTK